MTNDPDIVEALAKAHHDYRRERFFSGRPKWEDLCDYTRETWTRAMAFALATEEARHALASRQTDAPEAQPEGLVGEAHKEAWIHTILSLSGTEANRRAFMAGYNGHDCPSPVTKEKERAWARGKVAFAALKGDTP